MPKKTILLIASFISLFSCNDIPQLQKTGLEGKPIPAIDLLLNDSTTHINTSQASAGKPIVLLYFDPYCQFCQGEVRDIVKNIKALQNVQFYFLTQSPFAGMRQFYNAFSLYKYPNLSVGKDNNHSFTDYFDPQGYPYTAVYHRDKKLTKVFVGEISSIEIEKAIKE